MGEAALVKERIDAGRRLVAAADAAGVPVRAALWLYDRDQDRWSLVIEAGAKMGLRQFAAHLHAVAAKMASAEERRLLRDLLLTDVRLFTQPHPVAQLLRPSLGTAASVARARVGGRTVGNYVIDDAVLYRLERGQAL